LKKMPPMPVTRFMLVLLGHWTHTLSGHGDLEISIGNQPEPAVPGLS